MVPELGKPTDGENLNIAQEVQNFAALPADVRAILLRVGAHAAQDLDSRYKLSMKSEGHFHMLL